LLGEFFSEALVVFLEPLTGVFSVGLFFLRWHHEELLDVFFQFLRVDVEVNAEVAGLGFVVGHGDASGGGDEFIHRWGVCGDDGGFAAHGLDNVVAPSFGEGCAEVDAVAVEVLFDFLVRDVIGDEINVGRHLLGGIFFTLDDGELWPFRVFFPEVENGFGSLECAAAREVEKRLVVGRD